MLTPELIQSRQNRLSIILENSPFQAAAFNPGPTMTYLTGLHFHLMERPIVLMVSPGKTPCLVLPELETAKLEGLTFQVRAFPYPENPRDWIAAFQGAANSLGLEGSQVGVEANHMRVLELRFLEESAAGAQFLPADGALSGLRLHKDPVEADSMRSAATVAQEALKAALPKVRYGMTERELASELVVQLLLNGSDPRMPFSPIVSAGPNSANPHASPSDRPLAQGDLLLFDWGAGVNGYVSDITRTFALGEVDPELSHIAEVVAAANQAAREAAGPGVPMSAVDRAAREVIQAAGYAHFFTHRTGHGLGMEGHEEPYIRADNDQPMEPGMTFTIEPGVYLPGRGGVRIEDDVMVTENGIESFSDLGRELVRLL